MSWMDDQEKILAAKKQFPEEFGLRAFPGKKFTICTVDCYVNGNDEVMLYTSVWKDGRWLAFAKGTPEELRAQIVPWKEKT